MDLSTPSPTDAVRGAAIPHHDDPHRDDGIVSRSPACCDALERLERVAPIDTTVLNHGRDRHREGIVIEEALDEAQGRVSGPAGAAARLGVPASTLESKIKRLNIN